MRSAIGINHLREFSRSAAHAPLGLEVADDATAERRRTCARELPAGSFRQGTLKQLSPEVIRPFRDKDWRSGSLDCATTRRSTCRCAESVAKQQRRETWRTPVGGRQQDFRW